MIVITGAAGFIGSNLLKGLNDVRFTDIVLVDDFTRQERASYYEHKKYSATIDRSLFFDWIRQNHRLVEMIIHLGARTDTTEISWEIFENLNLNYSKEVFNLCIEYGLPIIYASSAATYGMGEFGYDDSHEVVSRLRPLNAYGRSKNEFDKWVLSLESHPFFWAGLKFFNVYGPNEYHKDRMASVIFHAFNEIQESGSMRLFRSHHPDFKDGEQARDFIYVKDVVEVIIYLVEHRPMSGLYNLGTGKASTFLDLVRYTFKAMDREVSISYIDTPNDIRDQYQYFTEANMKKLRAAGYTREFTSLKDGIEEYVCNFMERHRVH